MTELQTLEPGVTSVLTFKSDINTY